MRLPVAPATTVLLGLLGVGISEAVLAKELGQVILLGDNNAFRRRTGVDLVIELVRPSHCSRRWLVSRQ